MTPRNRKILKLLAENKTSKQIAEMLGLREETVKVEIEYLRKRGYKVE